MSSNRSRAPGAEPRPIERPVGQQRVRAEHGGDPRQRHSPGRHDLMRKSVIVDDQRAEFPHPGGDGALARGDASGQSDTNAHDIMLFATRPVSWQRWKAIFWTLAAFRHFTDSRMAGLLDIRACRGCSRQPGSENDRHLAKTTLSLAMLDRSRRRERNMKNGNHPCGAIPVFLSAGKSYQHSTSSRDEMTHLPSS